MGGAVLGGAEDCRLRPQVYSSTPESDEWTLTLLGLAVPGSTVMGASALAFCPVLDEMVTSGHALGRSGKLVQAGALSTANNLITLRNLHLHTRAQWTLETGMSCGGSALVFAQTHKDIGSPPSRQHVAIDPFQHTTSTDACGLTSMERAGLSGYLDFRDEPSSRALPSLMRDGRTFSIIYVDGSHLFEDVFTDLYYSAQLLAIDGIVLFDDSTYPHVRKALRFARGNFRHCLEELDLTPFRGATSLRYRVAQTLGRVQLTAFRKIGEVKRHHESPLAAF